MLVVQDDTADLGSLVDVRDDIANLGGLVFIFYCFALSYIRVWGVWDIALHIVHTVFDVCGISCCFLVNMFCTFWEIPIVSVSENL